MNTIALLRRSSIAFALIAITFVFTGCEPASDAARGAKDNAALNFAKKRIPFVRDIIDAALVALNVYYEIESGQEWKTAVANGFSEFVGLHVKNDLEKKLDEMTDYEIDNFYEEKRELLDPLIDERLQELGKD